VKQQMNEWEKMIKIMVDWIEIHIGENPSLLDMSKRIGYSPYYCSNQFRKMTGMTIRDYISRRRLYHASSEIINGDGRILDIALKYGYQSHEALTRAFARIYGVTPSDYRKNQKNYSKSKGEIYMKTIHNANIIIKRLQVSDIHQNMLADFDRYQEVTQCYRKAGDKFELKDIAYTRDWGPEKKQWALNYALQCIKQGGIVFFAYDEGQEGTEGKVVGIASVGGSWDGTVLGKDSEYANLGELLISRPYRRMGIGSALFAAICENASELNVKKLYTSSQSAKESIDFWLKLGWKEAQTFIRPFADHKDDIQLEYEL